MIEQLRNPSAWIEILVLAVAYYAVLTFIRGTRGAPILKALVALFVVAFLGAMAVSDALGLVHIKTLLQYLLSGSALALVVIFGPELRRALQHLAQSPLLSPLLRESASGVVNELADAAVKLSKNRIGALVALEREVGLNEYVENGCKIDAVLTSELLETIFYPGSALHDGAVVVRHDRVAAAGCLFPLTDDMSLSKSMGTRHRAGIGISEETDAVAVVVSEETGRISVVVGGKLTGDLNREQLVTLLNELVTRRRKDDEPEADGEPALPKTPAGPAPSNGNGHPPAGGPPKDSAPEIGRAREEAKS
jgi:diadenylate cyclase